MTKLDLEGNVLWTTAIGASESGTVKDIGVTSRGTIVVAGSSTGQFVADRSGYYAAVEPYGAVRFLRAVEPAPQALAVHPSGRAAMLLAPDFRLEAGADVLYANLDGELLWRASVQGAKRIAFAGDEVVVAAETAGTAAEDGAGSFADIWSSGSSPMATRDIEELSRHCRLRGGRRDQNTTKTRLDSAGNPWTPLDSSLVANPAKTSAESGKAACRRMVT